MVKINMMSGRRYFGDDWVHIDGSDLAYDNDVYLTKQYANSIDQIYCSHGIAYFSMDDVSKLLRVWFSRLRPCGILEVGTPDFDVLTKLYQTGTPFDKIKGPLYGEMKMNGHNIYHKFCYDEATLTNLLRSVGFVDIKRYDHRATNHPNTGDRSDFYDDHSSAYINGHLISLNMQATKP